MSTPSKNQHGEFEYEQELTIISESGLYTVILRSDRPEAKAFRRWVTHEVLPAIRKTGVYESPQYLELERQGRTIEDLRAQNQALSARLLDTPAKANKVFIAKSEKRLCGEMSAALQRQSRAIRKQVRLIRERLSRTDLCRDFTLCVALDEIESIVE